MVLNPYFLQGSKTEQNLVQSLVNEQIKIYGVECYYIPRKYMTTNTVIQEVIQSKFDDAYPIEAYVETFSGYEGAGDVFSKFGLSIEDDLTLTISRERFETYIAPLMKDEANIKLSTRPKEGDLVYFPLGDRLFEIKFVEHEDPFYQLRKNYVYKLKCELFRYEDEVVDTGVAAIDDEIIEIGYTERLNLASTGTTATGITTVRNGGVQYVTLLDGGYGFLTAPTVTFAAPGSGTTATGYAILDDNSVDAVYITNPGTGYSAAPAVIFTTGDGYGVGVAATVGIATTGAVGVVTVTNGGTNYSSTPTVTFSAPLGTGVTVTATGIATMSTAGIVTAIYVTNAGAGYTLAPTITLTGPTTATGGTYVYNEKVTGGTTGATALVKKWWDGSGVLRVGIATGIFSKGETITGAESGAVYILKSQQSEQQDQDDTFAENIPIQTSADGILDFTERNPFGEV